MGEMHKALISEVADGAANPNDKGSEFECDEGHTDRDRTGNPEPASQDVEQSDVQIDPAVHAVHPKAGRKDDVPGGRYQSR
jgi:hypothetical protein